MPCKIWTIGRRKMYNFLLKKLDPKTKIFVCKGAYPFIREALKQRGWFENTDHTSPCFDFKWTCKSSEVWNTPLNDF